MARHEEFERLLIDGTELLDRGNTDQAMSKAMEALTLRPGNPLVENLLGLALFARRRFREARDIFEGLVRRHPDVPSLRVNAGLTALRTDGANRARSHFEHVARIEPDHRRALGYLALLTFKAGNRAETASLLQRAALDDLAARLSQPLDDEATLWLALDIESRADQLPPGRGSGPLPPRAFEGFAEVMPLLPEDSWDRRSSRERQMGRMTKPVEPADAPVLPSNPTVEFRLEPPPPPPDAVDDPPAPIRTKRRRPTGRQTAPLWPVPARADLAGRIGPTRTRYSSGVHAVLGPRRVDDMVLRDEDTGMPVEIQDSMLILRVGEMADDEDATAVLLRQDQVVLHRGDLAWQPAQRRRMGEEQGGFEVAGVPIVRTQGDGSILLSPGAGLRYDVLLLREDALFLREEAVAAFSDGLFWENGRIPGLGADGPAVVHFKGIGFVAVRVTGAVQAFEVHRGATVRLSWLLGWTAEAVPQATAGPAGESQVSCSGPGLVLIDQRRPAGA